MISLDEARRLALSSVKPAAPVIAPLLRSRGLFLGAEIRAPRDLPGADNSAMDGFAIRAAESAGATRAAPARLRLARTIYAGEAAGPPLAPGFAARIFTGAPIPEGADAVLRQEAGAAAGSEVLLFAEARVGEHVRRRAEELSQGALATGPGRRIDAAALGLLASLGLPRVSVFPSPSVAVVTVGDELVPLGAQAAPHQSHESNGLMLSAYAEDAGATLRFAGRAPDDLASLVAVLGAMRTDLIVTAGGASKGDRDLVKAALRAMGAQEVFSEVALKPGKVTGLFLLEGRPVLVLPGNPGAAAVAFDQFARPMLFRLQGAVERRRVERHRLAEPRTKQPGLTYLLSARIEDGALKIRPQGAGQLLQNLDAEGYVALPPGRGEFARGEEVDLQRFAGATFEPCEPSP